MRRLALLLALPITFVACGSASTRASSTRTVSGVCHRVELTRVTTTISTGEVTLNWELASTTGVRKFQIEQKLGNGRWTRYRPLPRSARSDTLTSLPRGPATFRVWALLKHGSRSAALSAATPAVRQVASLRFSPARSPSGSTPVTGAHANRPTSERPSNTCGSTRRPTSRRGRTLG
jgi:hypothetical protein